MNEEYLPPDSEAGMEIVEPSPSALAIITQSEYAAMVATANMPQNKRKLDVFGKQLMSYATHSQPVALSMFYTLPRAGKQIVGPGVRFAEVVAPCWRNNSTGSRMMGSTEDTVTAQGVFVDYEFNNKNVKEIPRRITNSQGQKFNSDMILTTGKAALSIAYREAVLKGGVPMALWDPAYQQAKLTAVGSAVSHTARIDAAMEYLNKLGVSEWQICNAVGVTSPKELEIDHLVTLKTLCEEIKKGARTIEEVFGSPFDKEIESLFTQMGKNETEKRLLRQSYMGRAKELVEYLRERVNKPSGQAVGKQEPKPEPTKQAEASKPADTTQASQADETMSIKNLRESKDPNIVAQIAEYDRQDQAKQTQPVGDAPKRGRGRPPKNIDSAPEDKPESFGPKGQENLTEEDLHPKQEEKPATEPTTKQETGKFQF
jgi:hypothetical protein